jgi:primosomal protein N' (replication factor Y) (superfamily II helicase)
MSRKAYVRVAVDRPLDQLFDYACPEDSRPAVGQRVRVTFARGEQTGVVLDVDQPPGIDPSRIRALDEILDPGPILPPPLLELLRFAARYYQHPIGETVLNALPPALRKGGPLPERRRRSDSGGCGRTRGSCGWARANRPSSRGCAKPARPCISTP